MHSFLVLVKILVNKSNMLILTDKTFLPWLCLDVVSQSLIIIWKFYNHKTVQRVSLVLTFFF